MKVPIPDNPQHVENLCSIALLKAQGFEGPDASLEISLFEYNLAWRDLGEEFLIIYAIPSRTKAFDRCAMRKDLDVKKEFDWVNWEELMSFNGMELEEWLALPLPLKLNDLVNYHGSLNIFGESYWEGFKINP